LFETDPKPVNDLVPGFARDEDADTVDLWLLRFGGKAKSKEHGAKSKNRDFFLHVFFYVSIRSSLDALTPAPLLTSCFCPLSPARWVGSLVRSAWPLSS